MKELPEVLQACIYWGAKAGLANSCWDQNLLQTSVMHVSLKSSKFLYVSTGSMCTKFIAKASVGG